MKEVDMGQKIRHRIQKIIMPIESCFDACAELFYKGNAVYDREDECLYMGRYQTVDFATYLNSVSYSKWREYTGVSDIRLDLLIQGHVRIHVLAFYANGTDVTSKELTLYEHDTEEAKKTVIDIKPDEDAILVGFNIQTLSDAILYGGEYTGVFKDSGTHNLKLSIAMTTFKREKDVERNLELINRNLYEKDDEGIADNLYMTVVDNGRTLSIGPSYNNNDHIKIVPNPNVGGAGGYARGMIESMKPEIAADYVLLMDDDVLVLPESIARTFRLVMFLKEKYREFYINGAMLYRDDMYIQHEDIGAFYRNGVLAPAKTYKDQEPDHKNIRESALNECTLISKSLHTYGAWWFCCIPTSVIQRIGLPLPVFIRMDDMEYSFRNHCRVLTMNGICIWHDGFIGKYNPIYDHYQATRNSLIGQACFSSFDGIDLIARWKSSFKIEICKFHYKEAELLLKAIEDYMKGPDYLIALDQERNIAELKSYIVNSVPIEEYEGAEEINSSCLFSDEPRRFFDKLLYHFTDNGQRFCPKRLIKPDYAVIPRQMSAQVQKQTMHQGLLEVDTYKKRVFISKINKRMYRQLMKGYRSVLKKYDRGHRAVEQVYKEKAEYITSKEFWYSYLGLSVEKDRRNPD